MTDHQPIPFMPCVEPNDTAPAVLSAERAAFDYIGQALTLAEFQAYLHTYDFGSIPPDFLVIHNTANPDASWAPLSPDPKIKWDRDELYLPLEQVKAKRLRQLAGIRDYYISLGWSSGPHLFIDDRWIYLFTAMYNVGAHAKSGNSYIDQAGRLHYSIGIEVVGWFGRSGWPPAIQLLLRGAVQALQIKLRTFQIVYKAAPVNQPARHSGSIAFHRDFNKPGCPGQIITPAYAIPILAAEPAPAPPPPPPDPLRARQIAGPNGAMFYCGTGFNSLYEKHGGLSFFGYPMTDETKGTGQDGRACTWMRFERAIMKYAEHDGAHLALLKEAQAMGWL